MKAMVIQTKLLYSNKAYWIKLMPSAFKQSYLIRIMLIESNKTYVHSNKATWFK